MNTVHVQEVHSFAEEPANEAAWGDQLDFELEEQGNSWGNNDFEVPDVPEVPESNVNSETISKNVTPGPTQLQKWMKNSNVAGELVSAGAFSQAMQLMTRQAGVVEFKPLKEMFLNVFMSGQVSLSVLPQVAPIAWQVSSGGKPLVPLNLSVLSHQLKEAYKLVTQAKFSDALQGFVRILQSILLLSVNNENEENEAKELIKICVEYVTCMRLELARQEVLKESPGKALVFGYLMSMCKLQPSHSSLTLRSAITFAYKYKNYVTCTSLCKRFLELVASHPQVLGADGKQVIDKHKKLLAYCQQVFTNDLQLDQDLPETCLDIASVLCLKSFTGVSPSQPSSRCPFCQSLYHKVHKGIICETCKVASVGLETLGLKLI
jgi:coatomer protein complex subunit alpha (xenin)